MYSKELFSVAQQGMISLIKTNIGMLMEVTESVWLIVKQNLSTLTSIFGTMLSLFLGGGQAVITFLVNAVSDRTKMPNDSPTETCIDTLISDYFLDGSVLLAQQ